jgi:hypothetical protein
MAKRNVETPEGFASGLTSRALHCRELGHTWRSWTVTWDKRAKCYDRSLRCSSCHTVRHQVLDSSGLVLRNRYTYAEGYLAPTALAGQVDRALFRMESIQRFLDRDNSHLKAV